MPQNDILATGGGVPTIRFNGFTDPWEQRKFGEIATRESATDISSFKEPCVEYDDVIPEIGRFNKDISQKNISKKGIKFNKTHILYGKLRPYLHNWLNPMFDGIAVGDWWVLKPILADKNFLYRLVQTKQFDDIANQSAGSKMPRADWKLISNSEFVIPSQIPEQKLIGEYFILLDTLITLHQRKLDQEKKLKEYLLQNMFPKEGEDVPRIRFSGFNEPWEQRRLEEIFVFRYGDGNINPSDGGKYPVFGAGGVQGGYSQYNAEDSVIIGHMGDAGCVTWGNGKHFVTYNGTITKPKDNAFSAKFGYYLLLHMNLKKYRGGTGLPYLTYEMLNQMKTKSSTSVAETNLIAEILSDLDHLINLHQRKLESLKELKKGLLQKMFV